MFTLKADNRILAKNSKFSYLADNYLSGVDSVVVKNANVFEANDYVLLGEFGSETSEIVQISDLASESPSLSPSASASPSESESSSQSSSASPSAGFSPSHSISPSSSASASPSASAEAERDQNEIIFKTVTKFAHPQDTRMTVLRYNKVKFLHTTTSTTPTDTLGAISGYLDIQADDFYTTFQDSVYSTGYGWFIFYNETTMKATRPSNPIPYAGFEERSVKKTLDAFFSLLNNNERKLISNEDAFRWLNEAYAMAKNELNLVNKEYNVPLEYSISVVAGTAEYDLPSDFSDLISLKNSSGEDIGLADFETLRSGGVGYYLRNKSIGFSPTPTEDSTYYAFYKAGAVPLTSYYDNVDLPDNSYYGIIDHLLSRAKLKAGSPDHRAFENDFNTNMSRMKTVSNKRDDQKDSWSISDSANV